MNTKKSLTGKNVAILAAELYEDQELWYPYYRLKEAGAGITLVGPEATTYTSKHGYPVTVDVPADDADPVEFDGVVIPGGYAPDKFRRYDSIVQFVKEIDQAGKLVAAICHAGWLLISAGILENRDATSFYAIKDDMMNAGANFRDEQVVVDDNLVTSRNPDDLPYFLPAIISVLAEEPVGAV